MSLMRELSPLYGFKLQPSAAVVRIQHATLVVRPKAPWRDFVGAAIYAGDWIRHPSGETGVVVFLSAFEDPGDQWRVDYGTEYLSRLGLQIGEKGRAVVVAPGGA